jgi:hypothetical protein
LPEYITTKAALDQPRLHALTDCDDRVPAFERPSGQRAQTASEQAILGEHFKLFRQFRVNILRPVNELRAFEPSENRPEQKLQWRIGQRDHDIMSR